MKSSTWKSVVLDEVLDELLFDARLNGEHQSAVAATSQYRLTHRHWFREHQIA